MSNLKDLKIMSIIWASCKVHRFLLICMKINILWGFFPSVVKVASYIHRSITFFMHTIFFNCNSLQKTVGTLHKCMIADNFLNMDLWKYSGMFYIKSNIQYFSTACFHVNFKTEFMGKCQFTCFVCISIRC